MLPGLQVFGVCLYFIFWAGLWIGSVNYFAKLLVDKQKINGATYAIFCMLSLAAIFSINVAIISTFGS